MVLLKECVSVSINCLDYILAKKFKQGANSWSRRSTKCGIECSHRCKRVQAVVMINDQESCLFCELSIQIKL